MRASDQLVCDERRELISRAIRQAGVLDDRNFKLEWADEGLTTGYTLCGCVARAAAYMTYNFTHHKLGQPSSRLRFNEDTSYIGIIDGPLKLVACDMTYNQEQIYLGSIVHRAVSSLILDGYTPVAPENTL